MALARMEGRFSKHFDNDGNPSETLLRARQERFANWRTLQELADYSASVKERPSDKTPLQVHLPGGIAGA
jgi:hypothetical protein